MRVRLWLIALAVTFGCATAWADTGGSVGGGNWKPPPASSSSSVRIGRGGGGGGGPSTPEPTNWNSSPSHASWGTVGIGLGLVGLVFVLALWYQHDTNDPRYKRVPVATVQTNEITAVPAAAAFIPLDPAPVTPSVTDRRPVRPPDAAPIRSHMVVLRVALHGSERAAFKAELAQIWTRRGWASPPERLGLVRDVAKLVASHRSGWLYIGADHYTPTLRDFSDYIAGQATKYDQHPLPQLVPTAPSANTGIVLVSLVLVAMTPTATIEIAADGHAMRDALLGFGELPVEAVVHVDLLWQPSDTAQEMLPKSVREPYMIEVVEDAA